MAVRRDPVRCHAGHRSGGPAGRATHRPGSGRCATRSPGATTCSRPRSRCYSDASPSSPAASRWRQPRPWRVEAGVPVFSSTPRLPDSPTTLDLVAALVGQSLLRQEAGVDGEPRFGMLETVREYALEKLAASGEEGVTRDAHAAQFLDLAEGAVANVFAADAWANRLKRDHDNLRGALVWLDTQGQPEALLRLAGAVAEFCDWVGYLTEGLTWLERALSRADATPTPARARALCLAGRIAHEQGDEAQSEAWVMENLAIAHGLELDGHVCNALEALGNLAEDSGRYDLAERIFGQAITVCRAAGDHYNAANVLAHLGVVAYGQGKLAAATERLEGALAAVRGVGQAVPAFVAHLYLAHVAVAQGELDRAAAHCRDVLKIVEPWDRHGLARVVPGVALLAGARGQRGSAIRLFGAADGLREAIGLILELPERAVYERAVDSRGRRPPRKSSPRCGRRVETKTLRRSPPRRGLWPARVRQPNLGCRRNRHPRPLPCRTSSASPRASNRCCACSPSGRPTRRSPPRSTSARARSAATSRRSSTSSALPTAATRPPSPPATGWPEPKSVPGR